MAVGWVMTLLPEWAELAFGIPAILGVYGAVIWYRGFTPEDRALFRLRHAAIAAGRARGIACRGGLTNRARAGQ